MALPTYRSPNDVVVEGYSGSIGGTPLTSYMRAPVRGKVTKVGVITNGTITTSNGLATFAINGTAITGGAVSITLAGAAAGQHFSASPTAANTVVEDDVISAAPTSASGANVPGTFYAVIRKQ